ncbi:hypothetical protein [Aeribacillus pallidus]|uniref:hypothetical protein n=1 Tax=Aeribacillus pallidus TaxID=33936 RepID=UPI003D25984F
MKKNQALKDAILKANQEYIYSNDEKHIFSAEFENKHHEISSNLKDEHRFNAMDILQFGANGNNLKHEMALEAGLLFQIANKEEETLKVFGDWDYLSHQVIAAPFKIDYMDKMDIFGYRFIPGFQPTISRYLVVELKKDSATKNDVDQTLKYVE